MIKLFENSINDRLKEIAWSSDDAHSFYVNAYMEFGDSVLSIVNKKTYNDVYDELVKDKPDDYFDDGIDRGSIDEYFKLHNMFINMPQFKVIDASSSQTSHRHGATATATDLGMITVDIDNYFSKRVFDHEIGHQLCNGNYDLQLAIAMNYGNAFGETFKRGNNIRFWGFSYSSEESWADAYSYWINNKAQIKRIYPKSYDVVEHIVNNITNLKQIQRGFYSAFEDTFGVGIENYI